MILVPSRVRSVRELFIHNPGSQQKASRDRVCFTQFIKTCTKKNICECCGLSFVKTLFTNSENELGFHIGSRNRRTTANATGGMGTCTDCRSTFRLASTFCLHIYTATPTGLYSN